MSQQISPRISAPKSPIGYLIITHDNSYNKIRPLANWKSQKKFKTTVGKLCQISDQSNTGIRNYLRDAYNNGRRLIRDSNDRYHLVFEYGGQVFYCKFNAGATG